MKWKMCSTSSQNSEQLSTLRVLSGQQSKTLILFNLVMQNRKALSHYALKYDLNQEVIRKLIIDFFRSANHIIVCARVPQFVQVCAA